MLENIDKKSIIAVMTDNPSAKGLLIAKKYGIETCVVAKTSDKQKFKDDLYKKILFYSPDLLILAGFMSILSEKIVNDFYPNILNIHPSLLPKYKGLMTHKRMLINKEAKYGYSIHKVTKYLDDGNILSQNKKDISTVNEAKLSSNHKRLEHQRVYRDLVNLLN